jgi:ubiquinone/menaquinone biosynthesis C-methylase UbiE
MEKRKKAEQRFHNYLRDKKLESTNEFDALTSNRKWYSIFRQTDACIEQTLREYCPGKRVLDYCCGNGHMSERIAKAGAAEIVGIDISDISVANAARRAQELGLSKICSFWVMDAEKMTFPEGSFDVIYESSALHHLDFKTACAEAARVLKPHGVFICFEALGHNPLIQLYRVLTPHLRTRWETGHILRKRDIETSLDHFERIEYKGFFQLASLAAVPLRGRRVFAPVLGLLEALDKILLRLPAVKWQAWQTVFVLSAPKKGAEKKC